MRPYISTLLFGMILIFIFHLLPGVHGDVEITRNTDQIYPNPEWGGIPTISEDSIPVAVLLDGPAGPFINISENITGYLIAPEDSSVGAGWLNTTIANLSIIGGPSSYSLLMEPHPDANGLASFTLIAIGENSTTNRTAALRISSINDPPILSSIMIEDGELDIVRLGEGSYEIWLDGILTIFENSYINFTIIGSPGDRPEDGDRLYFNFDALKSDNWDNRPAVDIETGEVSLFVSTSDWIMDNDRLVFNIRDRDHSEITFTVLLQITHVNVPPEISLPTNTRFRWEQDEELEVNLIISDGDSTGPFEVSINLHTSLDGTTPPLIEQLPFASLDYNSDIGLSPNNSFWMKLQDPFIWKTGAIFLDEVQIMVTFMAIDDEGASVTLTKVFELVNINEPPNWTGGLNSNPIRPETGERVSFWVDPAEDPDGDELEYQWDFGDGYTGTGMVVEHIYYHSGWKTVQCWASDGNATTDRISLRIEVTGQSYNKWYDMDNDGDGVLNRDDDFPNDRAASSDSDDDEYPDQWNIGYNKLDSTTGLSIDMFPHDGTEWIDTDGDGHGDNGDDFPDDKGEWEDSDGDGIGNNADMFPNTPNDRVKWYVLGALSAILIITALILLVVRNTTSNHGSYDRYDEE